MCPVCGARYDLGTSVCSICGAMISYNPNNTGDIVNCPVCKAAFSKSTRVCPICGAHLNEEANHTPIKSDFSEEVTNTVNEVTCRSCGTKYEADKTICPNCGLPNTSSIDKPHDSELLNNTCYSNESASGSEVDESKPVNESEMEKGIIKTHDFEKAKSDIKVFIDRTRSNPKLDTIKTREGLFNLKEHKVNGAEINNLIESIQDYLIDYNEIHREFIDSFRDVYDAFEALDKDYISGILTAVGSAKEASNQALEAQDGLNKTIKALASTVDRLNEFKTQVNSYEHLDELDKLWKEVFESNSQSDDGALNRRFSEITESVSCVVKRSDRKITLAVVLSIISSALVITDIVLHILGVM